MADVLPLRVPPADPHAARKRRRSPLPLVVDARRLARLLCIGLRTVRTLDSAGKLPKPVKIGGRVAWSVEEIKLWIRAECPNRSTWEAIKKART